MARVVIVIEDAPEGGGALQVQTSAPRPAAGEPTTPAQALALDVLRTCARQSNGIAYEAVVCIPSTYRSPRA